MARTKVVVTADVEDPEKWEEGFRTHRKLFKSQTVKKTIDFGISGNRVAVCLRPDDSRSSWRSSILLRRRRPWNPME